MITKDQFGFNAFWWETLHTEDQMRECADYIAGLGYSFVEFKRLSFRQDNLAGQFKQAVKAAEAAGIKVSNFVVLRSLTTGGREAVDDVIETVRACSEAGIGVLNTVCGSLSEPTVGTPEDWWMPPQANHKSGWDNIVKALEEICEVADKCGVDLAIEPIVGTLVHDFYSIRELFSRFDHQRLGITMDPSHFLLYRNDIPYAIERLGDKIKHVHMKDAAGRPGVFGLDFLFPTLGAGAIDWKAFFNALDKINYTGAVSGEYEQFKYMAQVRNNDPQYAAKIIYEEMSALHDLAYK
ncbi:MAG: sugar phosphate isomerase/epimerase [Bacteroidota bacterium]|nr:sugar phosphate isomerase/epimerase [Bacteroidota bacterium]